MVNNDTADAFSLNLTTAQVIPLGIFCFFMTIFGLVGNGTVLYSSVRYNSIRLDKISLIFVKNLAAADILYTIFTIFPNFITFSARRWVLGKVWCFMSAQLSFIPGLVNISIVLCITLYRLVLVVSPFHITRCYTARIIAGGFWVIAIIFTLVSAIVFKATSDFNQDNGTCISSLYDDPSAKNVVTVFNMIFVILPMVLITLTNVTLCVIAFRHSRSQRIVVDKRKSRRNKGLVMICLLSGMFVASWLPYIIYNLIKVKTSAVSQELDILSFHCIFFSSFGNPILYSLTNKRFGEYVMRLVLDVMYCNTESPSRQRLPTIRMGSHAADRQFSSSQLPRSPMLR
ncbi:somatostatin receptor type 4-like [Bolinopsis microptera]|uniref:somatostatin receptor type 4-like n=1 Tax=Bolinopsis microptera TaxID=2820187 RepID=UPI00307961FA